MRTGHTGEQPAGGTTRPTRAWSKVVSARRPAGLSVRRGQWGGAGERPTWEAYPDWAPQVRVTSKFSKSPPPAPRPEAVQEREASQGPGSSPGAGQAGPQSAGPSCSHSPAARRPASGAQGPGCARPAATLRLSRLREALPAGRGLTGRPSSAGCFPVSSQPVPCSGWNAGRPQGASARDPRPAPPSARSRQRSVLCGDQQRPAVGPAASPGS